MGDIINSNLPAVLLSLHPWKRAQTPPCPGHGSGLGCPPAAVLEGLPSRIEGPRWPTVLGICPQYPPLQTRIIITVNVIVIIVTVGVPGMIFSLWDVGLGIIAHSCFGSENGF